MRTKEFFSNYLRFIMVLMMCVCSFQVSYSTHPNPTTTPVISIPKPTKTLSATPKSAKFWVQKAKNIIHKIKEFPIWARVLIYVAAIIIAFFMLVIAFGTAFNLAWNGSGILSVIAFFGGTGAVFTSLIFLLKGLFKGKTMGIIGRFLLFLPIVAIGSLLAVSFAGLISAEIIPILIVAAIAFIGLLFWAIWKWDKNWFVNPKSNKN